MLLAQYIGFVLTCYLALVLFTSAAAKLISVSNFRLVLQRQAFLPRQVIPTVGWSLPVVEGAIAFLLLVPATATWAGVSAALLLGLFSFVTALLVAQGRDAECGCFGLLYRERMTAVTVARDVTLVSIACASTVLLFAAPPPAFLQYTAVAMLICLAALAVAPGLFSVLRKPPSGPHEQRRFAQDVRWISAPSTEDGIRGVQSSTHMPEVLAPD